MHVYVYAMSNSILKPKCVKLSDYKETVREPPDEIRS